MVCLWAFSHTPPSVLGDKERVGTGEDGEAENVRRRTEESTTTVDQRAVPLVTSSLSGLIIHRHMLCHASLSPAAPQCWSSREKRQNRMVNKHKSEKSRLLRHKNNRKTTLRTENEALCSSSPPVVVLVLSPAPMTLFYE